jgi:hypothetical protein
MKIKNILVMILLCSGAVPAFAQKHLLFVDGYLGWAYSMPPYLSEHRAEIEQLPFSGFAVVGNVYTSYVMSSDSNRNNVTYERVWDEVKSLRNLFPDKENFLRINVDFPGDFWDDTVWEKTADNFAAVARAAKNLGFKGIIFDDETYAGGQHVYAHYMSNFKFPKKADVEAHPEDYARWEIDESVENRGDWVDYSCTIDGVMEEDSERCSYRNPAYSFKEHMDKVAARFKTIMEAMEAEFPDITVLVFHGPATAHPKTNIDGHYIKPNAIFETNEYKGAMFLGFKQGLNGRAALHDMGEFYRYHTKEQFQNAYQWRKHDIVADGYNQGLDDTYRWVVPESERDSWSDDVQVGFMVSDYALSHNLPEYDISGQCGFDDVKSRLTEALSRSDEYVIFYSDSSLSICEDGIGWLDVDVPVPDQWLAMMREVAAELKEEAESSLLLSIIPVISRAHAPGQPQGEPVPRPIYQDAANIPELTGAWYGAMGDHPVQKLEMFSPWPEYSSREEKKITLYFPSDVQGRKPTVFFVAGWGMGDPETYQGLLYFIASQGFNAVFVPGPSTPELGDKNILPTILDGVVAGPWRDMIDTAKVGYAGHSAGAGMLFYLAAERPDWGTGGRFLFPMAAWWGFHLPETMEIDLPPDTNLIVQVSHNDPGTDPRQNIDFLLHSNIAPERRTYLYIPGDADHPSNHGLCTTPGNTFDALDQVGLYRPLESLMRYSFNAPMDGGTWKKIGLPDPGDENYNVLYQLNGISVLSTDEPLENHTVPIPPEEDLDPRWPCSHSANPRRNYCMPCGNTDRDQPWQQCQ